MTASPALSRTERLKQAIALHQAGQLAEAGALYQSLLTSQPDDAEALHLYGLVRFQQGEHAAAEPLLRRAIALRGSSADYHFNLGTLLLEQDRFTEAESTFRQAAVLKPYDAGILNNLALALSSQQRQREAEEILRRALRLMPDDADLHFNLANTLRALGRNDAAEEYFRRTLALDKQRVSAWVNLGEVLLAQNRLDEAEQGFRKALEVAPQLPEGRNNLAAVLRRQNRLNEAETLLRQLLAEQPDHAEAWNNLGVVLSDAGRLGEAESSFRRALALRPDYALAWNGLSGVLADAGRHREAKEACLAALRIAPAYPNAHFNLGLLLLAEGDFAQGWAEYEYRLLRPEVAQLYAGYSAPLWQGESLQGRTILLHAEQGLGDTLQFIRFATLLASQAAAVIVECQPGLKRLLHSVAGISAVYAKGEVLPPHDLRCPLMSLPYRLGVKTIADIPAEIPYLAADPLDAARWQERLRRLPGLKVGLVWAGDPRKHDPESHRIDQRRSLTLQAFEPLFALSGISFISLQKGAASSQVRPYTDRVSDWMDEISDFADTAALVTCLDLVIAVDTSVAHLAGALGKQVWLLSRFDGCWRWLLERSDSPWYPSARIFRQEQAGSWTSVVAAIAGELGTLAHP